jgi:hypothetical protein
MSDGTILSLYLCAGCSRESTYEKDTFASGAQREDVVDCSSVFKTDMCDPKRTAA